MHGAAAAHDAGAPTPAGPVRETPTPSAAALPVITEIREPYSKYLHTQTVSSFKKAEEALFIAARDAENNVQQNALFDTMKDVERLREPIEKHFVAALVGHIDRLGSPMDALQEPDSEVSGSELSLVESGEFPDWLAWKNIYSRAGAQHTDALFKFDSRFGELVGVSVTEENNPVGLAVLVVAAAHTGSHLPQG